MPELHSNSETQASPPLSYRVAVLSVTYRRPEEFKRLLVSLRNCSRNIAVVSVCDNFGDEQTSKYVEEERSACPYPILYKQSEENGGFATGLNQAIHQVDQANLELITHYLICDDDIAFETDVLAELLNAMEIASAASAAPALTDHSGDVTDVPLLKIAEDNQKIEKFIPRDSFRKLFPVRYTPPITVCMGTCHLVRASAFKSAGAYREDFWLMGDDLDFSHRIATQNGGSIFVPWVFVAHLYGAPLDPGSVNRSNYLKQLALMQNYTYMAYHTPNGKYIRGRYLDVIRGKGLMPFYRNFLNAFKWRKEAIFDLIRVVYAAWVLKQPAGQSVGNGIRKKRGKMAI